MENELRLSDPHSKKIHVGCVTRHNTVVLKILHSALLIYPTYFFLNQRCTQVCFLKIRAFKTSRLMYQCCLYKHVGWCEHQGEETRKVGQALIKKCAVENKGAHVWLQTKYASDKIFTPILKSSVASPVISVPTNPLSGDRELIRA